MAAEPARGGRTEAVFERLLERDLTGRSWLPSLLSAAPGGRRRLGHLVERPGTLEMALSIRGISGRRGCLEVRAPATPALLRWFVEHPERLRWPDAPELTAEERILRRALVCDEPAGARARAQERAREALSERSPLTRGWWRFEEMTRLDCVLMTEALVVVIEGGGRQALAPVSEWYPQRPWLTRSLEAARELAKGRAWGVLLISEQDEAAPERMAELLEGALPHLPPPERAELLDGYLGALNWSQVEAACATDASRLGRSGGVV